MCAHIPFPLYLLASVSSTHIGFRLDPKYTIAEQVVIFSKLDCCYWCHLGASVPDIPLSGVPHTLLFACRKGGEIPSGEEGCFAIEASLGKMALESHLNQMTAAAEGEWGKCVAWNAGQGMHLVSGAWPLHYDCFGK